MKPWHLLLFVAAILGVGIFFQKRSNEAIAKLHSDLDAIHSESVVASADRPSDAERADQAASAALRIMQRAGVPAAEPKMEAAAKPAAEAPGKGAPKPREWTPADLRDYYAASFTSQISNAEWATSARRIAEERVRADLPAGSTLRSIDCRASMCRIETRHEDTNVFHEFARKAFGDPATGIWNGGAFSTIVDEPSSPGEPVVVVSYLAREGSNLPNPDAND